MFTTNENSGRPLCSVWHCGVLACVVALGGRSSAIAQGGDATSVEAIAIEAPDAARPPWKFSPEDDAFLDEVEHATFLFFWHDVHPETGMVRDRTSAEIVSVAGVGFQLSALPIGIERGWITREQGEARALLILRSLAGAESNRHAGLFFHYLDGKTGEATREGYETVASTIDTALLFAGVLTASSYFEGEIAEIGDALFANADWTAFFEPEPAVEWARGFVSLGWRPDDPHNLDGPGEVLPFSWIDAGAEHRLVTFLGVCAPNEQYRVKPERYYQLRRKLGTYDDLGPIVWFPWSGALFTAFFGHCWIDYAHMGADDPSALGVPRRSRVDWWENSRRLAEMHRLKAIENPLGLNTPGAHAWGLGASDGHDGYHVAHLHPTPIPMPGALEGVDYPPENSQDSWLDGTIAPYNAGASIMFAPEHAIAALRYYRSLQDAIGHGLVWKGSHPERREYGFRDAFSFDAVPGEAWIASDYVAIDQGPLLLAIENARSGLVWDLFASHPWIRAGSERLHLERDRENGFDAGDPNRQTGD